MNTGHGSRQAVVRTTKTPEPESPRRAVTPLPPGQEPRVEVVPRTDDVLLHRPVEDGDLKDPTAANVVRWA